MHAVRTNALCLGAVLLASGAIPRPHAEDAAAAERALMFDTDATSFGERYQHETVTRTLGFENRAPRAVTVREAVALAGDGRVRVDPATIPPHGRGEVRIEQPLGARLGRATFRYRLVTDEAGAEPYRLALSGFVQSAYDPEALVLDFRTVERESGSSLEFELGSREVERLGLAGVERDDDLVAIEELGRTGSAGEGLRLGARLLPGAPEGYLSGQLRLRTNVAHQPLLAVAWRAVVVGDVRPAENPVRLGLVELGRTPPHRVELRSASGNAVTVTRLESAGPVAATSTPCGAACTAVELQVGNAPPGPLAGELRVHLAAGGPIALRYSGVAVAPGTRIKRVVIDPDADVEPDPDESRR